MDRHRLFVLGIVTLNKLCLLSNPPPPPLFLMTNIKLDGIPKKIKWNIPVLHCISSFKGTYKKLQDIATSSFYFLLFYINFYISRFHFLQLFRTWFKIIKKKKFRHEFPFFNGFTKTPQPLNGQKHDERSFDAPLQKMLIKRWIFYNSMKLRLEFLFTDLSQQFGIYLVVFAFNFWIHGHE